MLQLGIAYAVGLALDTVAFANTVFAARAARSVVFTRPVAVNAPVIVGLAIVGALERTSEPEPVALVAPVPPFGTVKGFCSVRLLNVGDG